MREESSASWRSRIRPAKARCIRSAFSLRPPHAPPTEGCVRKESWAPFVFPAIVAAAWEAAVRAGWLDGLFFPAPSTLVKTFSAMVQSGEIAENAGRTLMRALGGFGI